MRSGGSLIGQATAAVGIAAVYIVVARPLYIYNNFSQLETALFALGASLLIAVFCRPVQHPLPIILPLIAFVGWVSATTAWAFNPLQSTKDAIGLVAIAIAAISLVVGVRLNTILAGIALGALVILLLSVIVAMVDPAMGVVVEDYESGTLRGIYGHRNALAHALMLGVPAAMMVRMPAPRWLSGVLRVIGTGILLAGVYATQSATSFLAVALVLVAAAVFTLLRWLSRRGWTIALVATSIGIAAAGVAALLSYSSVIVLLGRDPDLTGRTTLWDIVWDVTSRSPVVGQGWSWEWSRSSPLFREVGLRFNFYVIHAHNEFANWALTTGWIGLVLFLITMVSAVVVAIIIAVRMPDSRYMWAILALVATIGREFSEISETRPQGWFILVMAIALAFAAAIQRWPRRFPKWLAVGWRFSRKARRA